MSTCSCGEIINEEDAKSSALCSECRASINRAIDSVVAIEDVDKLTKEAILRCSGVIDPKKHKKMMEWSVERLLAWLRRI